MGLVTAVMGVGSLVSSVISGVVADRADRRRIMILCDVCRALFYLPIPLVWWLKGPSITTVYIVAAVAAYLTSFFIIAYTTAIPNIVDQDQIADANGRLQTTVALAYVAGPMLAGFASRKLSPTQAVLVVAVSYAISAMLMLMIRLRRASPVVAGAEGSGSAWSLENFLAGIRFLLKHQVLKPVTLQLAAIYFITGATINLSIYRIKHDFGRNDDMVGLIFGVASIGAIAGGILAPALRRRKGFGFCFLGGNIMIGVAVLLTGVAPGVLVLALLATSYSFGTTGRNVSSMSLRQQVTPDHMLGRVSSAFWIMLTVFAPLGTAVASFFAEQSSASIGLIVTGAICVLVSVAGLFTHANIKSPEREMGSRADSDERLTIA
jgi:MFS family permease